MTDSGDGGEGGGDELPCATKPKPALSRFSNALKILAFSFIHSFISLRRGYTTHVGFLISCRGQRSRVLFLTAEVATSNLCSQKKHPTALASGANEESMQLATMTGRVNSGSAGNGLRSP